MSQPLVRRSFFLETGFIVTLSLVIGIGLAWWLVAQIARDTFQPFQLPALLTLVLVLGCFFVTTNFFLDDGSVLTLPVAFMYGPDGEIVDGIGIPPDDEVQPTPTQLAGGQDPVLTRALQDFS